MGAAPEITGRTAGATGAGPVVGTGAAWAETTGTATAGAAWTAGPGTVVTAWSAWAGTTGAGTAGTTGAVGSAAAVRARWARWRGFGDPCSDADDRRDQGATERRSRHHLSEFHHHAFPRQETPTHRRR